MWLCIGFPWRLPSPGEPNVALHTVSLAFAGPRRAQCGSAYGFPSVCRAQESPMWLCIRFP